MKINQENIDELLRLGFRKSYLHNSVSGGEWWSLPNGWAFEIDSINSFYHLKNRIKKSVTDEGETWTKDLRSAYLKLVRKYPDPIKGATQTKKQKLARILTQAKKLQPTDSISTMSYAIHKNQIAIMEFLLDS